MINVFFSFFVLVFLIFSSPSHSTGKYPLPFDTPKLKFSIDSFMADKLISPVAIFYDNEHRELLVVDSAYDEVLIFDERGQGVYRFGRGKSVIPVNPLGIIKIGDDMYVTEQGKSHITILNYRGIEKGRITAPEGMEFLPSKIDVDKEGNIYALNTALNNCAVFDKNGVYKMSIGKDFNSLSAIAVGTDRVYLITSFYEGKSIHFYRKNDGVYMGSFEAIEGVGGTLGLPLGARVDSSDRLWLVDALKGVHIFDKSAEKIGFFGGGKVKRERIFFGVDIDFGHDNMIYLLDKNRKRISVFK